jgi:CelD/BcsL family acetyltransferase involved in cellulose biosynthesis
LTTDKPVFVDSARTALEIAFFQVGLRKGERILIPELVCDVLLHPILAAGLIPIYYPITHGLAPEWSLLESITMQSPCRALIMVHYFGQPQSVELFQQFCRRHNLLLVEDNAHGYGGYLAGKSLGSFGDIGVSSPRKILGTPSGGALYGANAFSLGRIEKMKPFSIFRPSQLLKMSLRSCKPVWRFARSLADRSKDWSDPRLFREKEKCGRGIDRFSFRRILSADWKAIAGQRRQNWLAWTRFAQSKHLSPVFPEVHPESCPWAFPVYAKDIQERNLWLAWGMDHRIPLFPWPALPEEIISRDGQAMARWRILLCFPLDVALVLCDGESPAWEGSVCAESKGETKQLVKILVFNEFSAELETHWKALEPFAEHHVFQDYKWLKFWQETIGSPVLGISPWIGVILDANDEPRMVFPLGVRRQCGVRVLEFLGGAQGDYLGPLIHAIWMLNIKKIEAGWSLASKQLPKHDVRHFMKLPAKWGGENNPLVEIWKTRFQDNSYSASLPATFNDFQARLRTKFRADTKRQRKRLAELGVLKFETVTDAAGWNHGIEAMISQKKERCRHMGVPDIFSDNSIQRFYREIPRSFGIEGRAHLSVLKLNDEILATHWGAIYRGRFYFLMPTFAGGKWAAYSTGRLLLECLVEWCIQNNLKVFDFTIGGEDYKKDWCDGEMPLYEHLRAITPLGFPCVAYIRLRRRARRNKQIWGAVKFIYSRARYGGCKK